jgi:molybdopterin synthase catalytic subunit
MRLPSFHRCPAARAFQQNVHMDSIRIQTESFSVEAESMALSAGRVDIGALVSFVGLVRDFGDQSDVKAIKLQHYSGMTEKALQQICDEAHQRWELYGIRIVHRVGRLLPADPIVLVITASAHRRDAFEACMFLMDYLKTRAPLWKKEITAQGGHWVEAKDSDATASLRWEQTPASA